MTDRSASPPATLDDAIGEAIHRVPRRPHAWIVFLALSQAAFLLIWWRWGWTVGLPAMIASHAPFWWGILWPHSAVYGPVLNRLPVDDRRVWLTIDDGPSDDTLPILDALDAHDAKATFFLVGERAAQRAELVREILRRGHGIGNHSHSHPARWFWALGPSRMRREIADTQRILTEIAGTPPRWFRAVVGMSNPFVQAPLKAHGLARAAWSARGFDGVAADPDAVVSRIERSLSPGAIVLLHEGAAHGGNVETIRRLLQRLDALGYRTTLPPDPDLSR
ncbi:MAG: polysaccharide deacetylase family protein [Lysobacter sp.]|nr:polysaccharide deacetylase family protein [Lysobacter sp.]